MIRTASTSRPIAATMVALLVLGIVLALGEPTASGAVASQLKRYPYLTDVVGQKATVSWATDRSVKTGSLRYGEEGVESCTAHSIGATKTSITVNSVHEFQWKAQITGLRPDTRYCYRVFLGTTDLLASDPAPAFWSAIPAGSTRPFTFAVIGDIGRTNSSGLNQDQANVFAELAATDARFVMGTGDTAYDTGSQTNYGDLAQRGRAISTMFAPEFWGVPGRSMPFFNAVGNHGYNSTFLSMWPQTEAVAASSGRYAMDTYCCLNGTASASYPSAWYAFDAGNARFYVLDGSWANSNTGTGSAYQNEYDYHWTTSSAEYRWLENDLATHPSQLKFAFFHYPMYSDDLGQPSDTYLQGAGSLEGLLSGYGVDIAFTGHTHVYERNREVPGGLINYVTGGGGAELSSIDRCSTFDAYSIGWSVSRNAGTACNAALPTSPAEVFHFLHVAVDGTSVTVTPTDSLGRTFDVQTFDFSGSPAPADTGPPSPPGDLAATSVRSSAVDLAWTTSTDDTGVVSYRISRDGVEIGSVDGSTTIYSDATVAPSITYTYTVRAVDVVGKVSDPSDPVTVTTPKRSPLFVDGFESGDLSAWTGGANFVVQAGVVPPEGGVFAGRAASAGSNGAYEYASFATQTELWARFRFQVVSRTGSVDLMRFRSGSGSPRLTLMVNGTAGYLATRNAGGTTTKSNLMIQRGVWYTLQVHAIAAGTSSVTDVRLDGATVPELAATGSLGTAMGQFLLGETTATRIFDVAFDDAIVDSEPL